jgi:membrane-associated phospholipid phosphatase
LHIFTKKCAMKFSFNLLLLAIISITFASAQNTDINILRDINRGRNQSLDKSFEFVSASTYPVSLAVPLSMVCLGKLNHNPAILRKGITSGIAITASMFLTTATKYTVDRKRPFVTYPDIISTEKETGHSFPSGHTTSAFCTATSLSLMYPKWYVIVPSYAWASTVAYSRMHLGAHYPSDVFVGAIIGAGTSFLSFKMQKWLQAKKSSNKPSIQ